MLNRQSLDGLNPMNGDSASECDSDECVPGGEDSECVFAGDASDFDDDGTFTL